jgi:CRP-like cAMP-binding protein
MATELEMLAASELFRGIEAGTLERLLAVGRRTSVPSGTTLFKLGEPATSMYVIARGRVALSLPIEIRGAQQDITVDERGPGDVIAWSALVPPHLSAYAARALIDSELVQLPSAALMPALRAEPAAGMQVMTNLAAVVGRRMHLVQAMWLRELQRMVASRYA